MWGMTLKVMREEGGVRALYRGLVATAMGVAPYVGKSAGHVGMPAHSLTVWLRLHQGSTSLRTRHSEASSRLRGRPARIESWHVARWRARYHKHSRIPSMSSGGRCKYGAWMRLDTSTTGRWMRCRASHGTRALEDCIEGFGRISVSILGRLCCVMRMVESDGNNSESRAEHCHLVLYL